MLKIMIRLPFSRLSVFISQSIFIQVANVKLCRVQNNQHSKNPDWWFAATAVKDVEDLAVLTGAANVTVVGKDDKSHVLLGVPAANKQSPILVTMEYPVTLSDHKFVVATKHKLIPSVYASQKKKTWQTVIQWTHSCFSKITKAWQNRCILKYGGFEIHFSLVSNFIFSSSQLPPLKVSFAFNPSHCLFFINTFILLLYFQTLRSLGLSWRMETI